MNIYLTFIFDMNIYLTFIFICAGIKTFYLELNIFLYLRKRTFNFCKTVLARNKLILKLCPPNCFIKIRLFALHIYKFDILLLFV